MTQGFIDWYDEQNNNQNRFHRYLALPDGIYFGPSTRVLYCCHTTGKWYESIELPTEKPFYLLPYGSGNCQRVVGAISFLEYIVYDTENKNNMDEFNGHHVFTDKVKSLPKVFYCYYEGKEDFLQVDFCLLFSAREWELGKRWTSPQHKNYRKRTLRKSNKARKILLSRNEKFHFIQSN